MPQYQGVWNLQNAAQLQSTQRWVTDPLFDYNTLLLQADSDVTATQNSTFLDSSSNNFAITRNGNTTQGTFSPFSQAPGYWGNYFNGSNSYLATTVTSSQFSFGNTGNFTVELWVFLDGSQGTFAGLINNMSGYSTGGQYANRWGLNVSGTTLRWDDSAGGVGCTTNLSLNTWIHIAVVRVGSTITLYINGTGVATQTANQAYTSDYLVNIGYLPGQSYLKGYISNVRIVKGTAVYTSNFTPPVRPLTNITNTVLLTCQSYGFFDNGTGNAGNPFQFTIGGTPSVQPFSPFAPQFQWTPSVIGGSGYFDGTGDFLTTPSTAALSYGTSDYSQEFWIYLTTSPATFQRPLQYSDDRDNIVVESGNFNFFDGTASTISAATTGQWFHLCVTRVGGTLRGFVNGRLGFTRSGTYNSSTRSLALGATSGGANPLGGYTTNYRIVKGGIPTAYSTSSTTVGAQIFTPPTTPFTGSESLTAGSVSLLLNFTNAGIYDGTMKNNLETFGNASINTNVVRYGSGSIFFDGTGDYITIPNVQQIIGTVNTTATFTIEGWIYPTARPLYQESGLIGDMAPTAGTNYWSFGPNQNGYLVWYSFSNATQTATSTFIPLNTWTHIAVSIQSGRIRLFVNGILQAFTGDAALTGTSGSVGYLTMGQWGNSTNYAYFGYVDDLRITRGVARYITSFTPPTVALPRQ